jgi:hypothetical protein
MNMANFINLTNVEMGLIIVEGSIVLSLLYLRRILTRSVGKSQPFSDSHQFREWVQESEAICQDLSRHLEERKEIAKRLIAQLDAKIEGLQSMLKKVDERFSGPSQNDMKKDLGHQIFEMAQAGSDVSEIARKLQISKGEVQLALDLKRYCQ